MSIFRPLKDGIELQVRATPKGGRDALDGVALLADGRSVLKVRVRAAPEDGAATAAVARVIAAALGVSASRVSLTSGATARLKTFHVAGDPETLAAALAKVAPAAHASPAEGAPSASTAGPGKDRISKGTSSKGTSGNEKARPPKAHKLRP